MQKIKKSRLVSQVLTGVVFMKIILITILYPVTDERLHNKSRQYAGFCCIWSYIICIEETKLDIKKVREEYAEAQAEIWYKQREARQEYKGAKKEMKADKKALRVQQRIEKRKAKEQSR